MKTVTAKEEKKLLGLFKKNKTKAEALIENPIKMTRIIRSVSKKADKNKGPLEEAWENIQLFVGIVKDYLRGNYKDAPIGSIVAIVGSLLYFLSPVDLFPDLLFGVGFIDDLYVINLAFRQVKADLEKYKDWKQRNFENAEVIVIED